jgi:hypothetical protein
MSVKNGQIFLIAISISRTTKLSFSFITLHGQDAAMTDLQHRMAWLNPRDSAWGWCLVWAVAWRPWDGFNPDRYSAGFVCHGAVVQPHQ